VFDTLTLADDRLEAFYDNPNALRDYFRDIGRMVLAAEGRKANDSHADCYQYFCVPEYGTANGRLHFHAVHFMRTLPRSEERRVGKECRSRWAADHRKKKVVSRVNTTHVEQADIRLCICFSSHIVH